MIIAFIKRPITFNGVFKITTRHLRNDCKQTFSLNSKPHFNKTCL